MNPLLGAVGPGFALPDGHDFLQGVDQPAAGFEGLVAVRAAHGDDDADLAEVEMADPMDDGEVDDRPPRAGLLLELGQSS